jgi:DNA-binding XRE family transcriptional regulator
MAGFSAKKLRCIAAPFLPKISQPVVLRRRVTDRGFVMQYAEYDDSDFYQALAADLRSARALVLIQSPYLGAIRLRNMEQQLRDCIKRGVRVCVFVRRPAKWEQDDNDVECKTVRALVESLVAWGVHVTIRHRIHEKYVVIDDEILWRGTLNSLSQFDSSEEMLRFESRETVLRIVLKKRLHECEPCARLGLQLHIWQDFLALAGLAVKAERESQGLRQTTLARDVGVQQRLLSEFERGVRNISMRVAGSFFQRLNLSVLFVPWHLVPIVKELVARSRGRANLHPRQIAAKSAKNPP